MWREGNLSWSDSSTKFRESCACRRWWRCGRQWMVLAGRIDKFPQPIFMWRSTDRDAMGPHCSALRHKVSRYVYRTYNAYNLSHVKNESINWKKYKKAFIFSIVRSGDAIYVRVGDHDLTRKYGSPGAQTLRVATTYIHHNHNSQTLDNDIALLKLHGQTELKDGVCLVCLPARGVSHTAGKRCTVTGYGYMGEGKLCICICV